ncbi:hypothetical protein [Microbulbifer epialgicus]|uniref:Uncharacterized protein n=1 Tax=Microbulbifer epialgicus TaxID=393907 RepID=A0ABV4P6Z6_9GAMM
MKTNYWKCNARIPLDKFYELKESSNEVNIGHEQLIRTLVLAALPVYRAKTPEDLKKALSSMLVLFKATALQREL